MESLKYNKFTTCKFFIKNKKRYCKFETYKNSDYCSHHLNETESFIPCPIDSSHKVLKNNVDKHVLICPKIKERNKLREEVWYEENINIPIKKSRIQDDEIKNIDIDIDSKDNNSKKYLLELYNTDKKLYEQIIEAIPIYFNKAIELYNSCITISEDKIHLIDNLKVNEQVLLDKLSINNEQEIIKLHDKKESDTVKNFNQCQALVSVLRNHNLLSSNYLYIEYGAGKGALSHHISEENKNQSIHILLEMEGRRSKLDKNHRDQGNFLRYRTDISHFNINAIPKILQRKEQNIKNIDNFDLIKTVNNDPTSIINQQQANIQNFSDFESKEEILKQSSVYVVGVSKHMCGGATDLSLQSLLLCQPPEVICKGIMIATCCHHRCTNDIYLNEDYLQSLGIKPTYLKALFHMSSWGMYRPDEKKEIQDYDIIHQDKLGQVQYTSDLKRLIGLQVKRILDIGRVLYLRNKGFKAFLLKYCEAKDSPENFVILAYK